MANRTRVDIGKDRQFSIECGPCGAESVTVSLTSYDNPENDVDIVVSRRSAALDLAMMLENAAHMMIDLGE